VRRTVIGAALSVVALVTACAIGQARGVPAGCAVMSDPAACDPTTTLRTEILPPGAPLPTATAKYCGDVIRLGNALHLYIDDPPTPAQLLADVDRAQADNPDLEFDPGACY
jgi:hypothetical protein